MRSFLFIVLSDMASHAYAQDTGTQSATQGMGSFLLMMGSIFAIFYFLLIRPQQKQRQKHEARVSSLKKGDRIIAAGGIYGSIIGMKDDVAVIKIAENVKIEVLKSSITHILGEEEKS